MSVSRTATQKAEENELFLVKALDILSAELQ
jgi:hypothetical protein